jgi:predicted CXXCH cytochrome family protein
LTRAEHGRVEDCVLEYAFGSGHHATTFVTVINPVAPTILEHRLTYYTSEDKLDITPGHEVRPRPREVTLHGGVPPARAARSCFACHATDLSARRERQIDDETMIPNVTCERCHGPGRAHVAAARRHAPEPELTLPFGGGNWDADALLALCGQCHRHPSASALATLKPDDPLLVRFQPVGISRSRCYRASAGALSCVSCHDPHARPATDLAIYDQVCLSCHDSRSAAMMVPRNSTAARTTCPVSPQTGCIDCHMPKVDAGQHVLFRDHRIRVHKKKS